MGYVGIFFLVFFGCVGVCFCWSGMGYFGSGYDVDGFILKLKKIINNDIIL